MKVQLSKSLCDKVITLILVIGLSIPASYAQFGPGVKINTPEAANGYVLLKQVNLNSYFLINNCGEVVNTWSVNDPYYNHAKLLTNGNLLFFNDNNIQERSWSDVVVNSITLNADDIEIDYEIVKMNNGNYLCVGRKSKTIQEFEDLGFDLMNQFPEVVDVVIEVDSISGDIIWEWDISDHIIQERNSNAGNYGSVADHPELINIDAISLFDWQYYESFMINGMDYNEELEQIALSVRKLSEIFIIDKTTTTEEAMTGEGGKFGRGGDILFRWGNPQNYGQNDSIGRQLYYQHNPRWITKGMFDGKLSVFNNGLDRPFQSTRFSEAVVIDTNADNEGNYSLDQNDQFSSGIPAFIFKAASIEDNFYSEYLSGAQILPNGNAFITVGDESVLKEFNLAGELQWEFKYSGSATPYRTEKYLKDYPAFEGRDLTPNGFLPNAEPFDGCELFTTSVKESNVNFLKIGIAQLGLNAFELINPENLNLEIHLLNINGVSISSLTSNLANINYNLSDQVPGMYILSIKDVSTGSMKNFKLVVTK